MVVDSLVYSFMMHPEIFKISSLLSDLVTDIPRYIDKNLLFVFKPVLKNVYKVQDFIRSQW